MSLGVFYLLFGLLFVFFIPRVYWPFRLMVWYFLNFRKVPWLLYFQIFLMIHSFSIFVMYIRLFDIMSQLLDTFILIFFYRFHSVCLISIVYLSSSFLIFFIFFDLLMILLKELFVSNTESVWVCVECLALDTSLGFPSIWWNIYSHIYCLLSPLDLTFLRCVCLL